MIELEKTYLAKYIPENLNKCESYEMIDLYLPISSVHPHLRLRKKGNIFEITKKTLVNIDDASKQLEQTISLTKEEFMVLNSIEGKRIRKIRYNLQHGIYVIEIDIFQDNLSGLVLVDVEFDSNIEKQNFKKPEFCLVDVTQEEFLAGGMLCGKSYDDISLDLAKFNYDKL